MSDYRTNDPPPRAERWINIRTRTVLRVLLIVLAAWALLEIVGIAAQVISWILISLFLALALNPAVEFFVRHGVRRRFYAALIAYILALCAIALVSYLFIPTLIDNVNKFIDAVPGYVEDLTHGEGRLGFLQEDYQVVDRVREFIKDDGAGKIFGVAGGAISITKSILTIILAIVTIFFMTFFMLLEGPAWMDRFYGLLPQESQDRWRRVGQEIYRTIGGYVTGNLLISVIAGIVSTVVLLIVGVPFAVALGLLVAILDLIPLAGATLAAILVSTVAFLDDTTAGIVMVVFFVVYQQIENHLLQPLIYGRTVQLSPLAVLVAVLIGAELAGVLGALAAIPVAGALQVVIIDQLRHRRARTAQELTAGTGAGPPPDLGEGGA